MAQDNPLPGDLGALLILSGGVGTLPPLIIGAVLDAIASYFQDARPADFDTFFRSALYFDDNESRNLTFRYLTAANAFGFAPGLSATKAGAKFGGASSQDLEKALRSSGIGKFGSGANGTTLELRLSDHLKQHIYTRNAKTALTPAKRDALRMESSKLLSISGDVWTGYYRNRSRMIAVGVRG